MKSKGKVLSILLITTFGFDSIVKISNLLTKMISAGLTGAFQLRLIEIMSTNNFIHFNSF
ncbi:hypothetical protein [Pleurocapsa sp. PCC 7319]|uniref:hypothetical protein n=1 Tax=Pleurocapsa sp. PCC 7319 TaxID=118161 RepID=UPI00035EF922|nr:hypothetical protein [Pleurocapsa sp. PCC 7319]